jgi:hypothetical protein
MSFSNCVFTHFSLLALFPILPFFFQLTTTAMDEKSSSATDSYETESSSEDESKNLVGQTAAYNTLQNMMSTPEPTPKPSLYPVLPSAPTEDKDPLEIVEKDLNYYWAALGVTALGGLLLAYWTYRH